MGLGLVVLLTKCTAAARTCDGEPCECVARGESAMGAVHNRHRWRRQCAFPSSMHVVSVAVLGTLLAWPAHAQFFQNFFQGAHMFQQRQEPEAQHVGDASWFRDRVQAAQCRTYLCPDTLACVDEPEDCPCPFAEQVRCMLDGTRVCVQHSSCDQVHALYRA